MRFVRPFFSASLLVAALAALACGGTDASNVFDDGTPVPSVDVAPNEETVGNGVTIQFSAIVRYADCASKDVTTDPKTVWNTSDAAVATVSTTGMVTTHENGLVDITVDYDGATGDEQFLVTP